MTSYTITGAAIEYYAEALGQFEQLLGRLTHKETQRMTHGELEALVHSDGNELGVISENGKDRTLRRLQRP